MARVHKPKLSQKIAGGIGNIGSKAIKIKRTVTHPHEEAIYYGSQRLIDYSKRNTGLKGTIRNRKQIYNRRTNSFVKIDTETGRFLGNRRRPYKRIRMR